MRRLPPLFVLAFVSFVYATPINLATATIADHEARHHPTTELAEVKRPFGEHGARHAPRALALIARSGFTKKSHRRKRVGRWHRRCLVARANHSFVQRPQQ